MNLDYIRSRCFNEGVAINLKSKIKIDNELYEKNICVKQNNEVKFNFVGIIISKKEVFIVFPKRFNISDDFDVLKKQIHDLTKALKKYSLKGNLSEEELSLLGGTENNIDLNNISTAIWLIEDFKKHGYITRQKESKNSNISDNIDWARTIKEEVPRISENGVYYFDLVSKKQYFDNKNLISRLHKYCVSKSFDEYGWVLGLNSMVSNYNSNQLPCESYTAKNKINAELRNTFKHREIKLLKKIREFILGIEEKKTNDKIDIFGTKHFYHIWEEICSVCFNNNYINLKEKYIPEFIYEIKSEDKNKTRRQIPDILYEEKYKKKTLFILDAKYYNFDISLPGWSDLVKQFYYFYSIRENSEINNFENVILMPDNSIDDLIRYYGKVKIKNNKNLGKIDLVLIDINKIINSYVERNLSYKIFRSLLLKTIKNGGIN